MIFKLLKNKEKTQEKTVLKNQKTKEKSRGRSMVEMLGVLAIIGVLSIGGIQGYTIAMRKHKANEILNSAQKYASVIYTGCQSAIMNDPDNYGMSEHTVILSSDSGDEVRFWECPKLPQYNNVGIGGMPSGLKNIYPVTGSPFDSGRHILSTQSGDVVLFYLLLDTQEVCRTIINTIGTRELSGPDGLCEEKNEGYLGLVSFIMN